MRLALTGLPLAGTKVVDDHAVWSYFAARFGLAPVPARHAQIPKLLQGMRVLVVGAGPSGLSAAYQLARVGTTS